jgi:lipid-A-disaccharide synthase
MSDVLIIAAEASSSLFAQRLLEYWKLHNNPVKAFGVGSETMEQLGFERLGKSEDMAVVGLAEIAEHYSRLKAIFNSILEECKKRKPKVAVLMDYPGFNLRLAKELHGLGIPVVYYISPQIWAWRKGRVKIIKKYCDKMLVVFPFEVSFFEEAGVPCEFVGHPVLDEQKDKYADPVARKLHRNRCGIQDDEIVIGMMPGSRKSEIAHHLDIQMEVGRLLYKAYPKIRVLLMCAPTVDKDFLQAQIGDVRYPYMLLKDDPMEMIDLTDLVLVASGTAVLQVGLLAKPMVIMYKFKWLTGVIAKMIVRGVKFFGIVNLILDHEAVPERWQGEANAKNLYGLMKRYLDEPSYKAEVQQKLSSIKDRLGRRGATARVAKALDPYLQGKL